jgi:capsular polysaccharide biosynthesis protein
MLSLSKASGKLNRLALSAVRLIPASSEVVGPPSRYCSSTEEWIGRYSSSKVQPLFKTVHPVELLETRLPRTIDEEIHWRFRISYPSCLPAAFVATIPRGRTWNANAVITPDDQLLGDVSKVNAKTERETAVHHLIFQRWKLGAAKHLSGTAAILAVPGGNTYAHWLLDLLPRLALIQRAGIELSSIDYFLVNGLHLQFQQETLKRLGIPLDRCIPVARETKLCPNHFKADQLIVPSLPRIVKDIVRWSPKWPLQSIRQGLLTQSHSLEAPRRIYISRSKAKIRRVMNEADVIKVVKDYGFQVIHLETYSVAEQATLLNGADWVIAPHGAGLANLIFCNPGTKLIEFLPPNYVNINYWVLCNQLGLAYYYLLGAGGRTQKDYTHCHQDDIKIDLNALQKTMHLAGL